MTQFWSPLPCDRTVPSVSNQSPKAPPPAALFDGAFVQVSCARAAPGAIAATSPAASAAASMNRGLGLRADEGIVNLVASLVSCVVFDMRSPTGGVGGVLCDVPPSPTDGSINCIRVTAGRFRPEAAWVRG